MLPRGLHIQQLSLTVPDGATSRTLLDSITLSATPGEVLGITGPSGSGKSTLLSVVGCLQQASSGGAVLHTDRGPLDLTAAHGAQATAYRRHHIGIVFQQPNLLPALSVQQQLLLMPRLDRVLPLPRGRREAAKHRATHLLEAVGLGGFEQRRVGELSGGQQARVNIARALMNSPELLLVDEPTAALDRKTAASITALIRGIAKENGVTTLYVSHDATQLDQLDSVIELVDGKLITS
ncbi:ATP-binding cassette domain-containing protein [Staphylococcus chromogenes]|nr:ATP-binding cassette domain-containing protein [Staphylococcus chromogenes]